MGGSTLIFLFFNIFIFTLIFWGLIFLTKFFYYKVRNKSNAMFYECGFKAYESIDFKITSSILLIAILLLLYDVEFLLILSLFINISYFSCYMSIFIIFIILFISFLLFIDNFFLFLYWQN